MWRFLKKLKIQLPYDPAIALLGIYPKDTGVMIHRGTCTLMLIAALSTIAKLWQEPKCLLSDEWIKNMWYVYTHTHVYMYVHTHICIYVMEYHSAIKKDESLPFTTTWMELECIMLSEIRQSEKDKYHMISLIRGI